MNTERRALRQTILKKAFEDRLLDEQMIAKFTVSDGSESDRVNDTVNDTVSAKLVEYGKELT